MMPKVIKHSLTWATLVLLAAIAWATYREHRLASSFQHTELGSAANETIARLGSPWRIGTCGEVFGGEFPSGCKEEYIYASPYAPIIPRYWVFRFDEKGRLIEKYEYQSP